MSSHLSDGDGVLRVVPQVLASQAEAEAGTEIEERAFSPLRVAQAVGALVPFATTAVAGTVKLATNAEAKAATATNRAVTPDGLPFAVLGGSLAFKSADSWAYVPARSISLAVQGGGVGDTDGIAMGYYAYSGGVGGLSIGAAAKSYMQNGMALGPSTYSNAVGAVSIGPGVQNAVANSVKIGSGDTKTLTVDNNATVGESNVLIHDVDNAGAARVSFGIADSGGSGYKVLRVPN